MNLFIVYNSECFRLYLLGTFQIPKCYANLYQGETLIDKLFLSVFTKLAVVKRGLVGQIDVPLVKVLDISEFPFDIHYIFTHQVPSFRFNHFIFRNNPIIIGVALAIIVSQLLKEWNDFISLFQRFVNRCNIMKKFKVSFSRTKQCSFFVANSP